MTHTALLDPETLAARAAIIAVETDLPDEEAAALALFWAGWVPPERRRLVPSRLTYQHWPLRPAWAQTVPQLTEYRSPVVLRPYQQAAADAAYAAWQAGTSVVLDLATGAGKSLVIAELRLLLGPSVDYGIYCAGLAGAPWQRRGSRRADARSRARRPPGALRTDTPGHPG